MLISFPGLETQETDILVRFKPYLLLLPLFVLFCCSELSEYDNQQIRKALGDSLKNTTEVWGVNMSIMEEGRTKLILKGSHSLNIKDEKTNIMNITGPVNIEIFNEKGILDTWVNSDSASYRPDIGLFELFGNVLVETTSGKELRSEYLKWQKDKDEVSTPEFVIFISPPDSIAANGFFGNSDLTNYTLNEGGGRAVID